MIFTELPNLALQERIELLEGRRLMGQSMQPFRFASLNRFGSLHIRRLQRPEKPTPTSPCFFPDEPLLLALYRLEMPLRYLVHYDGQQVQVHLLVTEAEQASVSRWVQPQVSREGLCQRPRPPALLSRGICFTGIFREEPAPEGASLLQTLVAGLGGARWQLLVIAHPRQEAEAAGVAALLREQIEAVEIGYLHGEVQQKDRAAQHYVKLLEYHLERFQTALHSGLWQTGLYFLAEDPEALPVAAGLICSCLHSDNPLAIPLRSHSFSSGSPHHSVSNFLTARELCQCFRLPEVELPGLALQIAAAFDIDPPEEPTGDVLEIGRLLDHQHRPCAPAIITPDNLNKHALVAGITGSGKTNTIFQILVQGWQQQGIPFLVIEPAKGEYRALFRAIPELQVYTPGYEHPEDSLPFRLNPFYLLPGVPLQTHIDHLKAVFFSSFALYPPMPHVLEECLYRVYLDRGWNLITGRNGRGESAEAFPTLDDLHAQIAPVVARLGYEERLSKDIRAALETRINSLRLGARGLMLNTREVPDFRRLFHHPTVLELKALGNEDEKAFLMALMLMFLYEYRESRHREAPEAPLHLLVIEEAHRLLRNTDRQRRGGDEANTRAEAIEAFTNILAEIRAYRQGVIIADQIPSHLAPEVLKNTSLKIAHRTVAFDEREILGQAMVCDEPQRLHLARLETGEAVVYQEGMDAPNLVRVHLLDLKEQALPGNRELRAAQEKVAPAISAPEPFRGERASQVLYELLGSDAPFQLVGRILLSILAEESPPRIAATFLEAGHVLEEHFPDAPEAPPHAFRRMVETELERRGQFYALKFSFLEAIARQILAMEQHIRTASSLNEKKIAHPAGEIRKQWISQRTAETGPFPGCRFCHSVCQLRYEGHRLAEGAALDADVLEALREKGDSRWEALIAIAAHVAGKLLDRQELQLQRDLVICFLNHKLHRLGFSRKTIYSIVNEIHRRITP